MTGRSRGGQQIAGMATAVTLVLSSQSSLSSDIDEGVAYYREKNFSAAFEIFLSSTQQGNAKAQYFLSTMYHSGMGVEPVVSTPMPTTASAVNFASFFCAWLREF